jgi:hypothetical protein
VPPTTTAPVSADEIRGLKSTEAAAVTGLVAIVLGLIAPVFIVLVTGLEVHYHGFHVGSGTLRYPVLEALVAAVTVAFLLALIADVFYARSFSAFRKVQPGFGGPFGLVIVGIVGTVLVFIGLLVVLDQIAANLNCLINTQSSSCISISAFGAGVIAIFFGLILALLGWIGVLIGVFRIGSRYHSSLLQVGAILTIIPIVTVVAPILILIGVVMALRDVEARASRP